MTWVVSFPISSQFIRVGAVAACQRERVASRASSRPRHRDGVDAMPRRLDAVDVIT